MSVIIGYLRKGGNPIRVKLFQNAMETTKYWNPDESSTWEKKSIAFGSHQLKTTRESVHEKIPYYDIESNCCITADARIDYRIELISKLGISVSIAKGLPDSNLILKAYLKWGRDCVKYLYGDFAFAIWDETKEMLFCARDHFGCRPFCYYDCDDFFVFSSTIGGIMSLLDVSLEIDEQFIVDCLTDVISSKDKTPYINVRNLEPSHSLTLLSKSEIGIEKYWDIRDVQINEGITEIEAVEEFKVRFQQSVLQRLRTLSPIGAELSGGLDSSGVVLVASELIKDSNSELLTFSHALSQNQKKDHFPFRDDRENIEPVIEKMNVSNHSYITAEGAHGALESLIDSMRVNSKPIIQHFAGLSDILYSKASQQNVKVLLSGFGGDEGVTYKGAGYFDELAVLNKWNEFRNQLRSRISSNGGSYIKSYLRALVVKIWPKAFTYFRRIGLTKDYRNKQYHFFALEKGISKKYKAKKRYFQFTGLPLDSLMVERQYKRIQHCHIPDRLEGSYLSALSKRIEYRYPMFDIKLLEYYFSLPTNLKYKNGIGRYIYRQSMEGILPEQIRMRKDRLGATMPSVQYRFMLDVFECRELILEAERTNTFHYIDYKALNSMADRLIERNTKRRKDFGPRIFLSYMSVIIAQKWQREGKINIGIKY